MAEARCLLSLRVDGTALRAARQSPAKPSTNQPDYGWQLHFPAMPMIRIAGMAAP